ncbi:hypothetical protein J2128_002322 [Methanomicrobium sp. W14]|uniref:hypothetical protein n=1 Tax=Methanomicrobium sp. W14 TaxID=2817839 RepID=UPI001AEA1A41|nr:hypothetical protein [Methanomicrobium sp. W14]MBP2134356.1 hypothetical protein [Methanomicrobium sp. W14]
MRTNNTKKEPCCKIFGIEIKGIDKHSLITDLIILLIVSVFVKLLVLFVTPAIFSSFIDLFDISIYLQYAVNIFGGQIPYVDFSIEYPVLFLIPVLLPLPFAVFTNNPYMYVYSYQAIMSIFDLFTLYFIYLIALKISNKKTAMCSGILYATAFSSSYFILTKYDSFPTFLLLLAVFLTVYNHEIAGYLSVIFGFFTKIFPIIAAPYIILYNSRNSTLKSEIIRFLKYAIPVGLLLFVPIFILDPDIIKTYIFATGTGSVNVYVNTATYTLYSLISITGMNLSTVLVSQVMYILMAICIVLLILNALICKIESERDMITYILMTLFAIIFFTKFHSPQYIVWITPFFALLLANSVKGIALFYIMQLFSYVEFPLLYNVYYTNLEYLNSFETFGWYMTVLFFTIEYAVMIYAIYHIFKSDEKLLSQFKKLPSNLVSLIKVR